MDPRKDWYARQDPGVVAGRRPEQWVKGVRIDRVALEEEATQLNLCSQRLTV